jgi:hypothetical protein
MPLHSKTQEEKDYLFEQMKELALTGTKFKDVQNVLGISRYDAEMVLKENKYDSYKTLAKEQASEAKNKAKNIMFNAVLNVPDPSLGNPAMAKELLKLHEQPDVGFLRLKNHSIDLKELKRVSMDKEYNEFKEDYDYFITTNVLGVRLKYDNANDCENDFEQLNKYLNDK